MARTSAVPNRSGSAATSSTGTPSTVTPTARRVAPLDERDDLRQRREARQHGPWIRRGADDRQPLARVTPSTYVARRLPVERGRDAPDELPARG